MQEQTVFSCHVIKDERIIEIIDLVKNKINVKITPPSFQEECFIVSLSNKDHNDKDEIIINMNYMEKKQKSSIFRDSLGTIILQLAAANFKGGDYTDWCRYLEINSWEESSKTIYSKIMNLNDFFINNLGQEKFDEIIKLCETKGLV